MADHEHSVSSSLPSGEELQQIRDIQAECKAEIDAIPGPPEDIVGDLRVCRFLRARHGNVKEATEWFRSFLKWRVESGIDKLRAQVIGRSPEKFLSWWLPRANPYLPICPYAGRTDDGHVIWYVRSGMIDPVKFVEHRQTTMEQSKMSFIMILEWTMWHLDELSRKEGRMTYVIKVADMKGLGSDGRKLPIFVSEMKNFMFGMLKEFQTNYCEHDALFIVVNAPFVFRVLYAVVKLVLSKRQISKMRILGDSSQPDIQK
ncbi:unnamed protein product, partial [Polarella glacialis]